MYDLPDIAADGVPSSKGLEAGTLLHDSQLPHLQVGLALLQLPDTVGHKGCVLCLQGFMAFRANAEHQRWKREGLQRAVTRFHHARLFAAFSTWQQHCAHAKHKAARMGVAVAALRNR